ncbi:MAG: hypothetical protein IT373_00230 [Polyangiaceae bacterium]|nr:hypothetical protein [Polyangiaceae bacterium]
MSTAITLPCGRCGAALPVDPTRASVACAYCGASSEVPAEVRERALAWGARVGEAHRKLEAEERYLGHHQRFQGARWIHWLAPLLLLVLVGGGAALAAALQRRGVELPAWVVPVATYGGLALVLLVGWAAWRRRKQPAAARAVAVATCERCGGPLTFAAGSQAATCPSCSAVALPSATVQAVLADAVEDQARDAEIARGRAERETYRTTAAAQRFGRGYARVMTFGWVVLLLGGALVGGVGQLVSGSSAGDARALRQGWMLLGVAGVGLALGAAGLGLYLGVVRAPARALERSLRAFAARLGGGMLPGRPGAALDWLDQHWLGTAPIEVMLVQREKDRWNVSGRVAGVPVLIVVLHGIRHGSGLHVFLAAPRRRSPGVTELPPARALAAEGLTLRVSYAGIALSKPRARLDDLGSGRMDRAVAAALALADA